MYNLFRVRVESQLNFWCLNFSRWDRCIRKIAILASNSGSEKKMLEILVMKFVNFLGIKFISNAQNWGMVKLEGVVQIGGVVKLEEIRYL